MAELRCLLSLSVTTHNAPCYCCSPFSSLAYYSDSICQKCPQLLPSPCLTLPLPLWDSRWRLWPSSAFCSGSPERPVAFGQHTARLPISHTKCKCLSFHQKRSSGMHMSWIYLLCWAVKRLKTYWHLPKHVLNDPVKLFFHFYAWNLICIT